MKNIVTPTQARANIFQLITQANNSHVPIHIHGKKKSAILIAEDDWRSIEETLYLTSIPGMVKSIIAGGNTPLAACEALNVEELKTVCGKSSSRKKRKKT